MNIICEWWTYCIIWMRERGVSYSIRGCAQEQLRSRLAKYCIRSTWNYIIVIVTRHTSWERIQSGSRVPVVDGVDGTYHVLATRRNGMLSYCSSLEYSLERRLYPICNKTDSRRVRRLDCCASLRSIHLYTCTVYTSMYVGLLIVTSSSCANTVGGVTCCGSRDKSVVTRDPEKSQSRSRVDPEGGWSQDWHFKICMREVHLHRQPDDLAPRWDSGSSSFQEGSCVHNNSVNDEQYHTRRIEWEYLPNRLILEYISQAAV